MAWLSSGDTEALGIPRGEAPIFRQHVYDHRPEIEALEGSARSDALARVAAEWLEANAARLAANTGYREPAPVPEVDETEQHYRDGAPELPLEQTVPDPEDVGAVPRPKRRRGRS